MRRIVRTTPVLAALALCLAACATQSAIQVAAHTGIEMQAVFEGLDAQARDLSANGTPEQRALMLTRVNPLLNRAAGLLTAYNTAVVAWMQDPTVQEPATISALGTQIRGILAEAAAIAGGFAR